MDLTTNWSWRPLVCVSQSVVPPKCCKNVEPKKNWRRGFMLGGMLCNTLRRWERERETKASIDCNMLQNEASSSSEISIAVEKRGTHWAHGVSKARISSQVRPMPFVLFSSLLSLGPFGALISRVSLATRRRRRRRTAYFTLGAFLRWTQSGGGGGGAGDDRTQQKRRRGVTHIRERWLI